MKTNKLLIIPGALVTTTLLTGAILTSTITKADGNTSSSDAVSITVDSACTMTGGPTGESTTDNTYSANVNPGSSTEITGSKLVTVCNDSNGYSIYATGYSGNYSDTYNTKLLSTIDHAYDIDTAVTPVSPTPSTPSSWAMKLEAVEGLTPPTIETGWDTYHVVPSSYTQIAEYSSSTASPSSVGATVQAKYQVYINSTQVADTYTGKVKYTMVHPDDAPAPTNPDERIYYNGSPLVFYNDSFWQEIEDSRDDYCLNVEALDGILTFEATSENSADVYIKPYATSDFTFVDGVSIETNAETGDSSVIIGESYVLPINLDYNQFTYHGNPLTSKDKLVEVAENVAYPKFEEIMMSLDVECIKKLIGEPIIEQP